jgi:hypothetical protein
MPGVKSANMIKTLIILSSLVLLVACASLNSNRREITNYVKDGKCTLHNVELVDEVLPIRYGLIALEHQYYEYHDKYFPNYEPFIMAGCFIIENAPKERTAKICPKCKEEYLRLKDQMKIE